MATEQAKKKKDQKKLITFNIDDDTYWKFVEWKAKFRVRTNEECVKRLIEEVEKKKA